VADFIGTINRLPCRIREGSLAPAGKPIPLEQAPHVRTQVREMVDVFFRPEHATVVEAGQGHLSATILATFFMGDRTRLIVKGSTPEHLTIEVAEAGENYICFAIEDFPLRNIGSDTVTPGAHGGGLGPGRLAVWPGWIRLFPKGRLRPP
jgi:ABC-type Fe3+/spermidine/putrescine transport system ATPase subunit